MSSPDPTSPDLCARARAERSAEELLRMSRLEEQEEKRREVEFCVMMCSLAILRCGSRSSSKHAGREEAGLGQDCHGHTNRGVHRPWP